MGPRGQPLLFDAVAELVARTPVEPTVFADFATAIWAL